MNEKRSLAEKLDSVIMRPFCAFASKANLLFGLTNFTLARGALIGVIIGGVGYISVEVLSYIKADNQNLESHITLSFILGVIQIPLACFYWHQLPEIEDDVQNQSDIIAYSPRTENHFQICKWGTIYFSLSFLALNLPQLIDWLIQPSTVNIAEQAAAGMSKLSIVAYACFVRCFTPPGTRGKIFEWMASAKTLFQPRMRPIPSPIRVT